MGQANSVSFAKKMNRNLVSIAQLVALFQGYYCKTQSLNSKFFNSPHLKCVNLVTKLLNKKERNEPHDLLNPLT
jgi:hypothetical protein